MNPRFLVQEPGWLIMKIEEEELVVRQKWYIQSWQVEFEKPLAH